MRVVVVKEYTDKYTGKGHVIGEKLTMTEERFKEIQSKGMFVVDISDEAPEKAEEAEKEEKPVPVKKAARTMKKESETK